jgi:hypothetical protein
MTLVTLRPFIECLGRDLLARCGVACASGRMWTLSVLQRAYAKIDANNRQRIFVAPRDGERRLH